MARPPKLRIHFESDVQYLLRLKHAIEDDECWPQDYKDLIVPKISDLVMTLMRKPERIPQNDNSSS